MRLFEHFKLSIIEFQPLKRSRSLFRSSDCVQSSNYLIKSSISLNVLNGASTMGPALSTVGMRPIDQSAKMIPDLQSSCRYNGSLIVHTRMPVSQGAFIVRLNQNPGSG
jgi:hypothetical protein